MPEGTLNEPIDPGAADASLYLEPVTDPARLRQRAVFLRELAEARALLARTTPWRTRTSRLRERIRQTTYHV